MPRARPAPKPEVPKPGQPPGVVDCLAAAAAAGGCCWRCSSKCCVSTFLNFPRVLCARSRTALLSGAPPQATQGTAPQPQPGRNHADKVQPGHAGGPPPGAAHAGQDPGGVHGRAGRCAGQVRGCAGGPGPGAQEGARQPEEHAGRRRHQHAAGLVRGVGVWCWVGCGGRMGGWARMRTSACTSGGPPPLCPAPCRMLPYVKQHKQELTQPAPEPQPAP